MNKAWERAIKNLKKKMGIDRGYIKCPRCSGKGYTPDLETDWICNRCGGSGKYYIPTHQEMG